jgi:PAT family beta-lactamase induction signal transducer AmpG
VATLVGREPAREVLRTASLRETLTDGVIGPFRDFLSRFAGPLGLALLLFVGLLKIPDQLLGVMAMPFYLDSGFSKTEIAAVSKVFGVWMGIAGAFLGGAAVVRFGLARALLVAMVLGAASNLLYLLLALFPGDVTVFTLVIAGENGAGGFLGAAAVAWLSALVNRRYTATQYALFSSLVTLPGKLIGGLSGYMVAAIGYVGFFVFTTLAILPAVALWWWLRSRVDIDHADGARPVTAPRGAPVPPGPP